MRILTTNDDGVHSRGLTALVRRLCEIAEVIAIAPERPRSATGHSITLHKPLRMHEVELPGCALAFSTNGTPSDCIVLGMASLDPRPELVISGINQGANLAEDLTYSGTVSAAMEAAICGLPAFAISIASLEMAHVDTAAQFACHLARIAVEQGLPRDIFLNVNVPDREASAIAGVAITRQGCRRYDCRVDRRLDPRGRPYYWLGGDPRDEDADSTTDIGAIAAGIISITPIHLDLTDYASLDRLANCGIGEGWSAGK